MLLGECFSIRQPDDFHVHLRRGDLMHAVHPYTTRIFGRALVMPNTIPPILTADDALAYELEIQTVAPGFRPLLAISLIPSTTEEIVREAKASGVVAGKVMLHGASTNSQDGAHRLRDLYDAFKAAQDIGLVVCVHCEDPSVFCLDRERAFLEDLQDVTRIFPNLKIVFEHITSREGVAFVRQASANVAATITVHHLYLTTDDVIGGKIRPHSHCLPIPKRPEDREALIEAATSGDPKFFLGTDSAPHRRENKECAEGCAGVFSAPVALPALFKKFAQRKATHRFEAFVSEFGASFYGLPLNDHRITIFREDWKVADNCGGIVPFLAGETLEWKVEV
jgi:dihydroorotase